MSSSSVSSEKILPSKLFHTSYLKDRVGGEKKSYSPRSATAHCKHIVSGDIHASLVKCRPARVHTSPHVSTLVVKDVSWQPSTLATVPSRG